MLSDGVATVRQTLAGGLCVMVNSHGPTTSATIPAQVEGILYPIDPRRSRTLSNFDARHRIVVRRAKSFRSRRASLWDCAMKTCDQLRRMPIKKLLFVLMLTSLSVAQQWAPKPLTTWN